MRKLIGTISMVALAAIVILGIANSRVEAGLPTDPVITYVNVGNAYSGQNLTFTVTCTNNTPNTLYPNPVDLGNVTIHFGVAEYDGVSIKNHYTYVSGSPGTVNQQAGGSWALVTTSTIGGGQSVVFTVTMAPSAVSPAGTQLAINADCYAGGNVRAGAASAVLQDPPGTPPPVPPVTPPTTPPPVVTPPTTPPPPTAPICPGTPGEVVGHVQLPCPIVLPPDVIGHTVSILLPTTFDSEATSDLDSLPKEEAQAFERFTLGVDGVADVTFLEPVDLLDNEFQALLLNLGEFFMIGEKFVELDADELPLFNIPAKLTFYNIDIAADAKVVITRNGVSADGHISNLVHDREARTVSFNVKGFSRYEVTEVLDFSKIGGPSPVTVNAIGVAVALTGMIVLLVIANVAGLMIYNRRKGNKALMGSAEGAMSAVV